MEICAYADLGSKYCKSANACLGLGGRFKDFSKIIALAKAKGNESLAARWQTTLAR
jgi:hypothetical protein